MARTPQLQPESQYPEEALRRSKQTFPTDLTGTTSTFTWNIASAADLISPWGRNVSLRDRQIRDFWPTEPYLAGAITNVGLRHSSLEFEIRGENKKVNQAVMEVLVSAIAGDTFGWVPFMLKYSQDLSTQDNGAFVELIREPGRDAGSKFKGALAPVLGIGHLDSNRCIRTGNPEYPIKYTDRQGGVHKLRWYEVIPFSDQPSAIETMNGVGYCAVSRVLRMAQIARSIAVFKDEKIAGRHYKQIHFVSGVSRQDIKDEMVRGQEEANSSGMIRFIMPAILASLDPEKPVSTATIDLASLPDGFDFDMDMKWYISCLALGFGVDYQEFAPLPGGNIGSSQQSMVLHRKGSGKGPAVLMRMLSEGFRNYGVLPRGTEMRFNDKDEQEELERQTVRTKAVEEMAIAVNTHMLTPEAAAEDMVRRGIWEDETVEGIKPEFWAQFEKQPEMNKQPVGERGGNTIVEDTKRQDTGKKSETVGDRLRKAYENYVQTLKEQRQQDHEELTLKREQNMVEQLTKAFSEARQKEQPPIVVNVPEQKAPVVNVNVPEQKAPIVTVNVPAQAAPSVTVKMPRVKESRQKVIRDAKDNIQTTVTEHTYEE